MFKQYEIKNYPFLLILNLIAITGYGIILIGSAKHSVQRKQILGFALGMIVMLFISLLDYTIMLKFSAVYYAGVVALLLFVQLFGNDSHGAQRWIEIAGIQFQPSEIAKIGIILFFAAFFEHFEGKINKPRNLILALVLAAVPMVLILAQPDTSTTIVCFFIFAVLLYLAGLSYKIILSVIGVCIPVGLVGIIYLFQNAAQLIEDGHYQVKRIMSWLDPTNPLYSDYATQQVNSVMAIGSGELLGKGLNNTASTSLKNANYIIEPQTDFIFAVAGEELGFIGTMLILVLILLVILQCIYIGMRAQDLSGLLICCGMAALIGFQTFVNICVATGLMPNTGVTLPFVSYGLTSLVSLYIGMGFVLNVGLQPRKTKGGFV